MLDDENQDQSNQKISFESLDILIGKWKDGTFSEIIDDWKWNFIPRCSRRTSKRHHNGRGRIR